MTLKQIYGYNGCRAAGGPWVDTIATEEEEMYIYYAMVSPCVSTEGEYQMEEISLCEYGAEWNGDVRGYVENAVDDADLRGEEALAKVRQNFGGLDPVPGSVFVLCRDGAPAEVYWASSVRAGWVAGDE